MVPGSRHVSWACSWVPSQSVFPKHELGNLLVRVLGLHLDDDFHFDTEYHLCVEIGRRTLLVRSSAIAGNRSWVRVLSEANVVVNVGSCAPTGPGELQIRTISSKSMPAARPSGIRGDAGLCKRDHQPRSARRTGRNPRKPLPLIACLVLGYDSRQRRRQAATWGAT